MSEILRIATVADAAVIAKYNTAMARETENLGLRPERIEAGVQHLLRHPELGFYLVAERGDAVVGCLLVTTEWSDWRNGLFWWIQSVYVHPDHRRSGIYRRMYAKVKSLAEQTPNVCGFRLYVEQENLRAQQTYARLGMSETHYRIYEELKPGVSYFSD